MDRTSKKNGAKRPTNRNASPAVTSSKTSTTPSKSRVTSSKPSAGSAEGGVTSPRARPTSQRRDSLRRRHSEEKRRIRRRIRRRKLPNRVVILEREKDRLENAVTRNSVSLVRITSKNIVYFVLIYSAVLCLRAAVTAYLDGVLEELRKKYVFSDSQLSLIQGTQVIGLLGSLFFVATIGRSCHKPLLLTVGVLVSSLGTMICAVPYFADKTSGTVRSSCPWYGASMDSLPLTSYAQACQYGQWNSSYISSCSPCLTTQSFLDERLKHLSILCVAGFLVGLGTGMFVTTGFVYIEESGNRKNGPIFYGVFLSMTGFGHFLGSCATWWFLGYSEDLQDDEHMGLPWTLRAWWLGFVFFSILLFLCSFFFLFFPKWITEPDWSVNARRQQLRHLSKQIEHQVAVRKLKRAQRKQKQRRRNRIGSLARSSASESYNEYVLPVSPAVSGPSLSTSGPVECLSPVTETTSVFSGSTDGPTQEDAASSSSGSDSETGPEVTVASPRRTSGGTGSALWIIAEEDSGMSRLPSSVLPVKADSEQGSGISDDTATPVWPLHLPAEANSRQSRVVTFASGAPDAVGNQGGSLRGYGGTSRRKPTEQRVPRRELSKKLGKGWTALKRTLLLPVFTLSLIGTVLSAYLSAGYRSNVSRFVEVQYGQKPVYAWFYTAGLCYSFAETIGPLIGGIIVHKLRLSLRKQIEMIICLLIINLVLFVLIFPINLPNGGFQWWQKGNTSSNPVPSMTSTCLTKCDCLDVQFDPVCSANGWTKYYSACHAGCTQLYLQNDSIIFSNCSCADGALASSSFCSTDFPIYGAFWVVLFLAITAHSMGQVSVILIFLRSVQDVDRHMALSIAIWIIVVAAFIPGPPVFNALEWTSCTASRSNCFGEDTCWLHDLDRYRYVIHGASMAFQLVAILFFFVALYPLRFDPIEPVGYGKEDIRSGGVGRDRGTVEAARGSEAGNEGARQSMMEMVQTRIASNLWASQQDLLKFSQPERKSTAVTEVANEPAPSLSSGFSELKTELEAPGRNQDEDGEERHRASSSGSSSVFTKSTLVDSKSDDDAEVTSRQTIFSDQSNDTVFARQNSPDGYENEAHDAEEDVGRSGGIRARARDRHDDSIDHEVMRTESRPEDNEDTASIITHNTRL